MLLIFTEIPVNNNPSIKVNQLTLWLTKNMKTLFNLVLKKIHPIY